MDLREQILRRRKDSRFIFGGLGALLLVCGAFYYMLQRGRGLPAEMASNKLLLFVLWYINIVLILAVLLVLVRSVFRLVLERQNRILGSKFKTKLVVTALLLSSIPVLILFPFATYLLLDSFDRWFTLPVQEVMDQAKSTAEQLTDEILNNNLRSARLINERLVRYDLGDLAQRSDLQHEMQVLLDEMNVDYLAVYDGNEYIHGTADISKFRRFPDFRGVASLLDEALAEGTASRIAEASLDIPGRLMLGASAAPRPSPDIADRQTEDPANADLVDDQPADRPSTITLVGTVLPPDIAQQRDNLLRAYQDYLQLSVNREPLRASYLLNLLMVTLLVILAFISIGLRLARRVTAPIQELARGMQRISAGDLDHQVDVAVDDELGVLVDGFNRMSHDLYRSRALVDHRNQELASSNKRLAAVLHNVAAGVIAIDTDSTISTCNDAALAILGQHDGEVVGRTAAEAWGDAERHKLVELLGEELPNAGGRLARQVQLSVGGVWKTLEVKLTALPQPSGEGAGKVMVLEDLTELIQAQKLATWNEVARRIAHEIKNPLTPIKLTAERLLRKQRAGDPQLGATLEQGVPVIVSAVESLKSMVDEFSRFARMPQPQPRAVEVEALFEELVQLHEGLKPGIDIHARVDDDARQVSFDPAQLKSVLINLVDNAMAATGSPGEVALRSRRLGDSVLIEVADTGPGIPPDVRERIFLPYVSTKGRGTGLGLAIVHRIVTDHHATIQVTDNAPRGAVFTLEIRDAGASEPVASKPVASKPVASEESNS